MLWYTFIVFFLWSWCGDYQIDYNHNGIYSNDNTYAVKFNPYINRPPTKSVTSYSIKPPPTNEHFTKTYNEPPTGSTDNKTYLSKPTAISPPLLSTYLNRP